MQSSHRSLLQAALQLPQVLLSICLSCRRRLERTTCALSSFLYCVPVLPGCTCSVTKDRSIVNVLCLYGANFSLAQDGLKGVGCSCCSLRIKVI